MPFQIKVGITLLFMLNCLKACGRLTSLFLFPRCSKLVIRFFQNKCGKQSERKNNNKKQLIKGIFLLVIDKIAEHDLMPASEVAVAVYLPTSVSDTDDILNV